MRKYGIRILSTFFLAALSFSEAYAFMMPPVLPTSPSLDFGGDAMLTAEGIAKKSLAVVDEAQRVQGEVISSLKSIDLKFPFKLDTSLFAKKGDGMWISSARKIEKSKIADITDEDSIVEAFYELFLTYPTDIIAEFPHNPEAVKQAYRNKSVEFGNDTMVEMYITVRELEEKMQTLKEEYESLRTCYVEGNADSSDICESASPNDDELGVWSNYYKLNAIYDSILKITEELMVLKAQYEVAQAVQAGIEPMMPEEENTEGEQSSSSTDDQAWLDNNGIFNYTISLGYAQILSSANNTASSANNFSSSSTSANYMSGGAQASSATTLSNMETSKEATSLLKTEGETFGGFELTNKNAVAEAPDSRLEPVEAKQYEAKSPFAGTAEKAQTISSLSTLPTSSSAMDSSVNGVAASSAKGVAASSAKGVAASSAKGVATSSVNGVAASSAKGVSSINSATTLSNMKTSQEATSLSKTEGETFGGFELTNKNAVAEAPDSRLEPAEAKQYEAKSPFAGTADQFQSLAESNNAYKTLQDAMKAHNLKQQLSEYKNTFVEYNKMVELHQKAIEQLMKSEQCVVDYLNQYYKDGQKVWLGNGCSYSGNNIVCDSGRALTADNLQNLLPGDGLCANNQNMICSNYGINSYSSRGGMSGWLISAYKLAKAETAVTLTDEDFATSEREDKSYTAADMEAQAEELQAQNESGLQDSSMLKPSKEEEVEAGSRQEALISWQLGAELAKEIGKDMGSSVPKWGEIKSTYKIWNDEKYFYNQYLKEKYQNMKYYIRDLDMRVVAVELAKQINDSMEDEEDSWLDLEVTLEDVKAYNSQALENLLPLAQEAYATAPVSEVELVQEASRASLNQLRSDLDTALDSLNTKKANTYEQLDTANIKLNDMKEAYNTAVENRQNAEANVEYQEQVIQNSQAKKAQSADYKTNFENEAENEIATSEKTIETSLEQEETAMLQADNQRDAIYELNSELSGVEDDIERQKNDYAATASSVEYENRKKVENALKQLADSKAEVSLSESPFLSKGLDFQSDFLALKQQYFMSLIGLVDKALENAKEQAIAAVEEGYEQIESLGDGKYGISGGGSVRSIHREIMENISQIQPEIDLSGPLGYMLEAQAVSLLVQEAFSKALTENVCPDESCYAADSRFFVGASPKKEDFQAPKSMSASYTAPLREVVHFDNVDFESVIKSDSWYTTRQDFLNYGQDIPQIWKTILTPGGFVERDVDIAEILSHNQGASDVIGRGTEYPCTVGKYDLDIYDGEVYVYDSESDKRKRTCNNVTSVNVYFNNIIKLGLKDGGSMSGKYEKPETNNKFSELAVLLQYNDTDGGGLTFNDKIKEIMQFYEDTENATDTDDEDNEKYKSYEKQLLTKNQFSDYLSFVELEQIYQEAVDELNVKIEEVRNTLSEALQEVGYTPASDFNLADEKTYNEISEALESRKNTLLSQAVSQTQKLQPLNDTLSEKIEQINKVLSALQMDKDEMVLLSDNMSGDSDLSEQIKSKQTDNQVRSEYNKEAEDEFERNLNSFEEPYCAIYN